LFFCFTNEDPFIGPLIHEVLNEKITIGTKVIDILKNTPQRYLKYMYKLVMDYYRLK